MQAAPLLLHVDIVSKSCAEGKVGFHSRHEPDHCRSFFSLTDNHLLSNVRRLSDSPSSIGQQQQQHAMASCSTAENTSSADEPPPRLEDSLPYRPFPQRHAFPASLSDVAPRPRKLNLLVAANGPRQVAWAETIAVRLSTDSQIAVRAIVDEMTNRLATEVICHRNHSSSDGDPLAYYGRESIVSELVEWADLLVLAPITADHLAKMIHGIADTLLLQVLRSWDTSKRIFLVPGMSNLEWENPVTKKQMSKLHRKYQWVRVLPAIHWHFSEYNALGGSKRVVTWDGLGELLSSIKNQRDLLSLGLDVDAKTQGLVVSSGKKTAAKLPPEIWSIIFEYAGDWELAQACGIYTSMPLPTNLGWRPEPRNPADPVSVFQHELEWTLLTANTDAICKKLSEGPDSFRELSALATKLIFKFTLIDVLHYIEANCPQIFKSFDGKTIPTKASAYYPRLQILDWWSLSPSFLEKHYDNEALDVASKHGYVHVLTWWLRSGLPLKYTTAALEQASAHGHLDVLEWWRDAYHQSQEKIEYKPGKSILLAAQYGRLDAIRWWVDSGLTFSHEEQVCKQASRFGKVEVLELWRELKGDDKLTFDNQILIEPTLCSHLSVLDWWVGYAHGQLPGMDGRRAKKVQYRMMDIEEALEDAHGDQTPVRRWWAEHGLNLALGTTQWMTPREL